MQRFSKLFVSLEDALDSAERVDILVDYFKSIAPTELAWALHLLRGEKLKRVLGPQALRSLLVEYLDLPEWLISESIDQVSDLAEAAALLTSSRNAGNGRSLSQIMEGLSEKTAEVRIRFIMEEWSSASSEEVYLFNKLLLGTFKSPIARRQLVAALAIFTGVDESNIAHRLTREYDSIEEAYDRLLSQDAAENLHPHSFALASPIEAEMVSLLNREDYQAEWFLQGIRAQLLTRGEIVLLWLRSGELVSDLFPEIIEAARSLPDRSSFDGQIVVRSNGDDVSSSNLTKRLAKRPSKQTLRTLPAAFIAFDLIEYLGEDLRHAPLQLRRERLDAVIGALPVSETIQSTTLLDTSWPEHHTRSAQETHHGLILKRRSSAYQDVREESGWYKWRRTPERLKAILLHAERGDSGAFEQYTLGIWNRDILVPIAKVPLDLTGDEIAEIDRWIEKHTLEKFGPVRTVPPELVFEIEYDSMEPSSRRKAGLQLLRPKAVRWLRDLNPDEVHSLDSLRAHMRDF